MLSASPTGLARDCVEPKCPLKSACTGAVDLCILDMIRRCHQECEQLADSLDALQQERMEQSEQLEELTRRVTAARAAYASGQ